MSEQRLIDANSFYKQLEEIRAEYIEENTMSSIFAAEIIETVQDSYLKDAPTIDPARHGKWEDYDGVIRINCSNCGKVYLNTTILEVAKCNFCPNCGAKMDKE